jgi:hypothetical protein
MTQTEARPSVPTGPPLHHVTAGETQAIVPEEFDWVVYADATAAGLAVLVPIPFLDWALERYFRRRMPRDIAWRNGRRLMPAIGRALDAPAGGLWPSCLLWPVQFVLYLLKNIYRTVVYVLSIKDATDNLSYYWHRAFLIDYMARRGDLDSVERAQIGGRAMNRVLGSITTSPLTGLAQKIVQRGRVTIRQGLRLLFRWRLRQEEPAVIVRSREEMAARWSSLHVYFAGIARRYDEVYSSIERLQLTNQV